MANRLSPHYAIVDIGAYANQAHNDWLQWTAEGGIPFGLLTLCGAWEWSPSFSMPWETTPSPARR